MQISETGDRLKYDSASLKRLKNRNSDENRKY